MNLARPLLISTDTDLVDDCVRLAAASGTDVHVATQLEAELTRWTQASLVLIDAASASAAEQMPRRSGVIVVTRGSSDTVDPNAWRLAVSIGAEHVACLPDAEKWLIERLNTSSDEPTRAGHLIAFLPATGGAGATTLAAACAVHAASEGHSSLLIDGDRLGGGIDLVLGGEDSIGVRWPELVDTRGRLATSAFRDALPTMSGAAVLSWDREGAPEATSESWSSILDAGIRGFDFTIVDLPRNLDSASTAVLSRAHAVVLVVSARVRGAIAATRYLEELTALAPDIRVVVRERPHGVRPEAIGEILGLPILGTIPVGTPFTDDGQLPRIPDSILRACVEIGASQRPARAA